MVTVLKILNFFFCHSLVLPLVTNQLVYALDPGRGNDTLTDTYASFGFLYGSIPTAPTVFLYATHYQESINMVCPVFLSKGKPENLD